MLLLSMFLRFVAVAGSSLVRSFVFNEGIMDLEKRLIAKGEGEGVGWIGELGVNRCKLLLLEWISNEILLCSTENYV